MKEDQLIVIPNFVPDPKSDFKLRKNFFLYVGRISKEKGVDVLLKAFTNLGTENLVIVGDGPEKDSLEKKYSSASNITFVGKKDTKEVFRLLSETKAHLFPSHCYENLPFTIIESFSTATPVIASRLGAMLEIVKDGYNGFHFTPGDAGNLESVLLKFDQLDREEQQQLCIQARMSYDEKFHPDAHYKALMNVYENALEEKKK